MKKLAFIGLGNMGRAIASGIIKSGALAAENVYGYAPHWDRLESYARETGLQPCRSAPEAVEKADTVLIAVKPYVIEGVLSELKDALKGKALISVALGYDYDRLSALLDGSTRIQFVMPNTPAMVGAGVMLFEQKNSLEAEERAQILSVFAALGAVKELPSHLMGIGGAISGCGPAFCALVIEALADAGVLTEVHIYPKGRHGLSLCNDQTSAAWDETLHREECAEWPRLAARFLKNL